MFDSNIGLYQVQVTALRPIKRNIQNDFFNQNDTNSSNLDDTLDAISKKFGEDSIKPARLLTEEGDSPDVIAPAWRPSGYRKSV